MMATTKNMGSDPGRDSKRCFQLNPARRFVSDDLGHLCQDAMNYGSESTSAGLLEEYERRRDRPLDGVGRIGAMCAE